MALSICCSFRPMASSQFRFELVSIVVEVVLVFMSKTTLLRILITLSLIAFGPCVVVCVSKSAIASLVCLMIALRSLLVVAFILSVFGMF